MAARSDRPAILMVDAAPIFGGAEIVFERTARLIREHFRLSFLVANPRLHERLIADFPWVRRLPSGDGPGSLILHLAHVVNTISAARPDLVFLNGDIELCIAPFLRPFCRLAGAVHMDLMGRSALAPSGQRRPPQALKRLVYRGGLACMNRVVCMTEAVASSLPLPKWKVWVISNWVCDRYLAASHPASPWTGDGMFHLTVVGRLIREKGHLDLFQAVRQMNGVRIHVVGSGPDAPLFRLAARGLDVVFTGYLEDPLPVYRQAHAVVLPSYAEGGTPLALMEAMALGIPCIGSDLPSVRELITDSIDGIIRPAGDPAGLAAAIVALKSDPVLHRRIGDAGRRTIRERFDGAAAQSRYIAFMRSAMGRTI